MVAEENKCKTIAFPSISTGAYGAPIEKTVKIVKEIIDNYKTNIIEEVIFVLFRDKDLEIYKNEFHQK